MNKRLLLISTLFVVSCLGWPGFGKKTPEFKIGDSIEVPENRIIIDKRIFVRPLDLNEPELITHASFMDLYEEHEASCLPTIIVRVNQGENELIYNLYDYYSWITKNPGRSPINTPIQNQNYYHLKKIGEKLCLINLGDTPAISVDDMIYYCCSLEQQDTALWSFMINSICSLISKDSRIEGFQAIVSNDTAQFKLDKLMRLISTYIETDPFIHLLRFYCYKDYARWGRHESAIELFNAINFAHLNSIYQTYAKYWLGTSLSCLNRDEEAIKSLEEALGSNELNANFQASAKYWLGVSLSALNRNEEALKSLEEALGSNELSKHDQACAKYWLGVSLSCLNRDEEAIKALGEALGSNELNFNFQASAKYYLGVSLSSLDRDEEAIKALEEALGSNELNSDDQATAKYFLGTSLSSLDRDEEAIKPLQEALSSNELNANLQAYAKYWLGVSLSSLNRDEEAIKSLEESLASNELNADDQAGAKYWLGRAKLNSNLEEAKLLLKEAEVAEQLDEIEAFECRKRLLILELKENQREEADKYLTKILSSAKDGIKTRVDLGKEFINHNSESFLSIGYKLLEQAKEMSEDQKTYYHEQVSSELMHALGTRVEQIKSSQKLAQLDLEVATVKSGLVELRGDIHEMRREFSQVNGMLALILSGLPISQASSAEDI